MKKNQKKMVSDIIKESRLLKGYTQKELSEVSKISIRSIQRIENGEIIPRSYTLKTLAEVLGLSFDILQNAEPEDKLPINKINKTQKLIFSIGIIFLIIFLAMAFIAQSPKFPETHFEAFLFASFILVVVMAVLLFIWRNRS
jgi:transcriptional regulator with XRE-family HTH domain